MARPIRRVVTGHDATGRSVFVMDGPAPHVYCRSPGSAIVTELWETRASPADNRGRAEVTDHPFKLAPPRNGSVFRIIEYPPDRRRLRALAKSARPVTTAPVILPRSIAAPPATPASTRPTRSTMPSCWPARSMR